MTRRKKPRHEFEVKKAIASRAMVAHIQGMLPYLRMEMETTHDEVIIIEMPFEVATTFLNQAISAHSTIVPQLKVPRQTPYG